MKQWKGALQRRRASVLRVPVVLVLAMWAVMPLVAQAESTVSVDIAGPAYAIRGETIEMTIATMNPKPGAEDYRNVRYDLIVEIPGGCADDATDPWGDFFDILTINGMDPMGADDTFHCGSDHKFHGYWGAASGFSVAPGFNITVPIQVKVMPDTRVGPYVVTQQLVDVSNGEGPVLASDSTSLLVLSAPPTQIDLTADTDEPEAESEVAVTATVTDDAGNPVTPLPVMFVVQGANPQSDTVTTDDEGHATFTYTGTVLGQDTIKAFADKNGNGNADEGEIVASKTITWRPKPGQQPEQPVFTTLTPEPFSTVAPGAVTVGVEVTSHSDITSVVLTVNGEELDTEPSGPSADHVAVSAELDLEPGVYTATAVATDADGHTFRAQWDFVVSSDANANQWFAGDGTPNAEQINATMRSLVEAFRWHLFGLTWDGTPHPEMPSHTDLQGVGSPLETWVSEDGTFDQAATEATLQSLVEAFRWHFWGEGWDNAPHCDVPTHAPDCNLFTSPSPIDPWFDEQGNPIPDNISATLQSLVESFRWHFWGYSWDGQDHPEMPTHVE